MSYADYIYPVDDHVFARELKPEERKSAGGIVIPQVDKPEKRGEVVTLQAVVVAVGPRRVVDGYGLMPLTSEVGNRILFAKLRAVEVEVDGHKLWVIKDRDIMAVLPQAGGER